MDRIGPPARHHPKEILRVTEPRVGTDDALSLADPLVRGHDRPELGDELAGLAHVRRARHVVPFGVETVHVRDGRPEDVHRWRMLGHRTEQPQDGRGKGARRPQVGLRLLELFPIREMSLQEEEDGLLERRVRGEIADVVPAVQEAPRWPSTKQIDVSFTYTSSRPLSIRGPARSAFRGETIFFASR